MATAKDVIAVARKELGYRESATNHQKFSPAVSGLEWSQNQPWCHTFISWVFQKADARDLAPVTASCLVGVDWFKRQRQWSQTPKVGSVVYYGVNGGTHVELVTEVSSTRIRTIGGNTSGSLGNGYFNGDAVAQKYVNRNEARIFGYGHPAYEVEAIDTTPPKFSKTLAKGSKGAAVKLWQSQMFDRGWAISVDGVFGSETENIAKQFQREKDLEIDGVIGPETWAAAWTEAVT